MTTAATQLTATWGRIWRLSGTLLQHCHRVPLPVLPDWHVPEIVPDSTSDLYSFQVSPMPSTSEATTDEDEEGKLTEDIMKLLEQTGWQPTNVDGKGTC